MTSKGIKIFSELLGFKESSGRYNVDTKNGLYWGKYQFGRSRITDLEKLTGDKITTRKDFTPELQEKFFLYHVADIEKFITDNNLFKYCGKYIRGESNVIKTDINLFGLIAGAHLGGKQGLKNYLVYGIDKKDSNGTYISDYVAYFSLQSKKKVVDK